MVVMLVVGYFAGDVCYADDTVLLAPPASAQRLTLSFCESHELVLN